MTELEKGTGVGRKTGKLKGRGNDEDGFRFEPTTRPDTRWLTDPRPSNRAAASVKRPADVGHGVTARTARLRQNGEGLAVGVATSNAGTERQERK